MNEKVKNKKVSEKVLEKDVLKKSTSKVEKSNQNEIWQKYEELDADVKAYFKEFTKEWDQASKEVLAYMLTSGMVIFKDGKYSGNTAYKEDTLAKDTTSTELNCKINVINLEETPEPVKISMRDFMNKWKEEASSSIAVLKGLNLKGSFLSRDSKKILKALINDYSNKDSKHLIFRVFDYMLYVGEAPARDMYDSLISYMEVDPSLFYTFMLKVIAVSLDEEYEGNIRNSEEIFTIDNVTSRIIKLDKSKIKGYYNFPAFRSLIDAKYACAIMSPILKVMYGKKKRK